MVTIEENAKMTDCYFEKKDWRACTSEVSLSHLAHNFFLQLFFTSFLAMGESSPDAVLIVTRCSSSKSAGSGTETKSEHLPRMHRWPLVKPKYVQHVLTSPCINRNTPIQPLVSCNAASHSHRIVGLMCDKLTPRKSYLQSAAPLLCLYTLHSAPIDANLTGDPSFSPFCTS